MEAGKNFFSAKNVTGTAVLLALVIVLQAVGGTISIGVAQLNFTLIPIVLGAVLFGPLVGAFLGLACGVVVLIQVIMGGIPFYALIWTNDPVVTTLTCILKTTAAGFVAGWIFKLLQKKNDYLALFVASGIVPVINTALFILGCLCMTDSVYTMAGEQNVLVFILVGIVTFNFFIEFGLNLIVAPALQRTIGVINRIYGRKKA
ncbi:MAG: ECF transporter S component [Clostridia bacterium]|nr:ECF transporter S component [Clostridia bacterium]